jgi:hypothetical protein
MTPAPWVARAGGVAAICRPRPSRPLRRGRCRAVVRAPRLARASQSAVEEPLGDAGVAHLAEGCEALADDHPIVERAVRSRNDPSAARAAAGGRSIGRARACELRVPQAPVRPLDLADLLPRLRHQLLALLLHDRAPAGRGAVARIGVQVPEPGRNGPGIVTCAAGQRPQSGGPSVAAWVLAVFTRLPILVANRACSVASQSVGAKPSGCSAPPGRAPWSSRSAGQGARCLER